MRSIRAARSNRPSVTFIAWGTAAGRAVDIASDLKGEAWCIRHPKLNRLWLKPLRYALSSVETAWYFGRRRPQAVIVTNPPILPGLIAVGYSRLAGVNVLLDSHPGAFGAQGDRLSAHLQWLHRWLARRVAAVLVTTDEWVQVVQAWGGQAEIVHEAPPQWSVAPLSSYHAPPRVLCVGIFAPDEPVAEVVSAARLLPEVVFRITGDLAKRPPELKGSVPPNAIFTGFLHGDRYRQAIEDADVVLTLTTEPTSVMRAACEAVYAQRPVVVSDWPALRRAFPYAQFVSNDAVAIAAGVLRVLNNFDGTTSQLTKAVREQRSRWERQREQVRARLSCPVSDRW